MKIAAIAANAAQLVIMPGKKDALARGGFQCYPSRLWGIPADVQLPSSNHRWLRIVAPVMTPSEWIRQRISNHE